MALPFQNNLDTGSTSGTAISGANSGGGVGNTAFTGIPGTAPTYSNVVTKSGSLSMLVAAAAQSQVSWTLAAETHIYGRFYVNPSAIPTASIRLLNTTGNVSGINLHRIAYVLTTGKLQVNILGLSTVSTVNALTLNAWTRVEYECIVNGVTATINVTTYAGDSTTPIETISTNHAETDANMTLVAIGAGSSGSPATIYFDDLQVNNTGLPGPSKTAGTAAGTVSFTGAATGTVTNHLISGTAAGTVAFTGAAAGTVTRHLTSGTAAGTVTFTGAAAGTVTNHAIHGSAAGTVTFTGAAAGTVTRHVTHGTAAGTVAFTGAAAGTVTTHGIQGTGAASVSFTGAAAGTVTRHVTHGTAAGSVSFTGAATGTVAGGKVQGTAAMSVSFILAAIGTAPAQPRIIYHFDPDNDFDPNFR